MIAKKMEAYVTGSSLIRAMFEESKKMALRFGAENVFDFSLGNPFFPPPPEVKAAIEKWLAQPDQVYVHGYMNNSGYPEVREKIATSLNRRFQTSFTQDNLVMTVGAAGGLNTILKVLVNPGEEIVAFAPYFGEYNNYAANVDAQMVIVPPAPPSFEPNLDAFEGLLTARTKAVIINSPNNPTGVVYGEDTLGKLADILRAKQREFGIDIYLISDEPYRELVYTGKKVPFVTNYYENAIVGYSYSKSLTCAGERIGYLAVPAATSDSERIVSAANVMTRTLGFVNAPSLMQLVIAECVDVNVDISNYRKNRDTLFHGLADIGYKCVEPEGAFYLFVESPLADDLAFCNKAKEFQLAIVPGRVFGCEGYFRLAYCTSHDKIVCSLPMFQALWDSCL
ncbi:MAG: pyridoxal phosphate-dependent aminotransferase [Spirochaetaceae bacterium]|jgi:aspartate aminotransferase|nr:pyridoxal phosphate-dependent aminotransferase [Spirochaetaceae bacterium]